MHNKNLTSVIDHIKKFRRERDWEKFHNPKDLAEAITVEASELLELFLWMDKNEAHDFVKNPKNKKEIIGEIADIFAYLLFLAEDLGVDLEKAVFDKYEENAIRYPVEKSKGKATKYTKL